MAGFYRGVCVAFFLSLGGLACSSSSGALEKVDLGSNYEALENVKRVSIETNDGKKYEFSSMRVFKVDEEFIYAHCWTIGELRIQNFQFPKQDIVIEIEQFQPEDQLLFRDLLIRFGLFWAMVALWG